MSLKKFSETGAGITFKKVIKKENLAQVVSRFRRIWRESSDFLL